MKKFVLICFCVLSSVGGYAQNWDINTLHKINSLDSKFARNYSKAFSKSAPYIAVGVPVAMAVYAGIDKDKELLKRCHLHRYECGRGSRDYVWYEICF